MKTLYLERDLFGPNQTVPVFKGDRWRLRARIGSKAAMTPFDELDLTGKSVTGYFPAASGGAIGIEANIEAATSGRILFDVPPEITENLLETSATDFYAIVDDGPETYETQNQPLEIKTRSFTSC